VAATSGKHNLPAYNSAMSRARLAANRKQRGAPTLYTARGYGSVSDARYAASRLCVNAEPAAWRRPADGKWVPIVMLRIDQCWMLEHVGYMGLVPWPAEMALPA
jgi:hypothetical protein